MSHPSEHPTPASIAGRFPAGFQFGASTSAYQIEGAVDEDGRGSSIWDVFSHTPGRVARGENGDVAVDHYHRWEEDIALMGELGLDAYSLTVAWPRIVPDGDGEVEPRGLAFYRRLVDGLRDAGIEPLVTLYHWDLPQSLQDRGGWSNRATVDAFVRYARIVHAELGDAVSTWKTVNEPWCAAFLGHGSGEHAPGITDPRTAWRAAHHLLLAHGDAIAAMREQADDTHRFGFVPNLYGVVPASDSAEDREAAATIELLQNGVWLEATLEGHYPDAARDIFRRFWADDAILDGDLERIAQPLDLLGINYYTRYHVHAGQGDEPVGSSFPGADHVVFDPPPGPQTEMGWGIEPDGLRELLLGLHERYALPPVLICENGAAFDDVVDEHGEVDDRNRVAFLADHLLALADAIDAGVDVRGYFVWSLLDNFEWAHGYDKRFGIVRVDPDTLDRRTKASGRWYREVLAAHG